MKNKYMFLATMALALGFSGCSSDEMIEDITTPTDNVGGGNGVSFAGIIADDLEILPEEGEGTGSATRSAIVDGKFAQWHDGDKVTISDGMLSYQYEAEASTNTSCKFQVTEGGNEFINDTESSFHAFYPAEAVKSWNGTTVSAMVYAGQDYAENIDGGLFGAYMATKEGMMVVDGNVTFKFSLVASVVDVNLSTLGVTPASVSLKSNNGEIIAGLLKYDCSAKTAKLTQTDATYSAANTQSDVITVSNVAADAKLVRFYILPVQLKGGVTITVKDVNGNYYTKTTSTDVGTPATEGMTAIDNISATVCKPYYKKYNFGAASTATRTNNWMATIPSNTRFCMLSIPASHDAATSTCSLGSAVVQSKTIEEQLAGGLRGFDFRPNYKGTTGETTLDNLYLSHTQNTKVLFKDAMNALVDYVTVNPTEAIYVRLSKNEGQGSDDISGEMRTIIRTYLNDKSTEGKVVSKIENGDVLGNYRGKIVITSNNPYGEENDLENTVFGGRLSWSDNTTGENVNINHTWSSWTSTAYVQDNYDDMEATPKINVVKPVLDKSSAASDNVWYLNWLNTSVSSIIENLSNATIKNRATTINNEIANYITNTLTGRTGIVMFDFCLDADVNGDDLNTAIINQNAKYVYDKRTRTTISEGSDSNSDLVVKGDEVADDSEVYAKER